MIHLSISTYVWVPLLLTFIFGTLGNSPEVFVGAFIVTALESFLLWLIT